MIMVIYRIRFLILQIQKIEGLLFHFIFEIEYSFPLARYVNCSLALDSVGVADLHHEYQRRENTMLSKAKMMWYALVWYPPV